MRFQCDTKLKVILSFAVVRICFHFSWIINPFVLLVYMSLFFTRSSRSWKLLCHSAKTKLYSRSLKLFFLLCKELVYFPLMWKYWRDLARVFAVDIKFFVRAFLSWYSIGVNLFEMSFGVSTVFQANSENDLTANSSIQDYMCLYTYLLGREWG